MRYNKLMVIGRKRRGFTIIEVVLVLAIAGLIFLMVFIALPALQRSQRDTQRKNDVDRIAAAVNSYISNNNKLPFGYDQGSLDKDFIVRYVDSSCAYKRTSSGNTLQNYEYTGCSEQFTSPDGTIYRVGLIPGNKNYHSWDSKDYHRIYFQAGAKCSGTEGSTAKTGLPRDYIVATKMEGKSVYCVDNH